MSRKYYLSILLTLSMVLLAACGSDGAEDEPKEDASSGESFVIGSTQILEHPSLDAAYEGFKEAIEDAELDVKFDHQNAQNDQNNVKTIADNFVADNVDLIFANSTPSAVGALNATNDIPILFTSVTDAVEAGLVESMEEPNSNISGVVDLHPDAIEETVKFIDTYFKDAKIGLIYNAGEKNSVTQIEQIEKAIEGTSLSTAERTVANTSEVQQAANTLAGDVDVMYIITDNTVVAALDSVIDVANAQKIPLIVGEPDSLAKGGFATFGIDYKTIGYRTGEMAVEVLTNKTDIKDLAVEYPGEIQLFINKEAAEAQDVEWQDEWEQEAEFIEAE